MNQYKLEEDDKKKMSEMVSNSIVGLKNLKETYINDTIFQVSISDIINELERSCN